jgi:hypothetical protein
MNLKEAEELINRLKTSKNQDILDLIAIIMFYNKRMKELNAVLFKKEKLIKDIIQKTSETELLLVGIVDKYEISKGNISKILKEMIKKKGKPTVISPLYDKNPKIK